MRYLHRELEQAAELAKSPFLGALFEGFIAAEMIKAQINRGQRPELYHFRDEQGLEVDFLMPGASGAVALVECKAACRFFQAPLVLGSVAGLSASTRAS